MTKYKTNGIKESVSNALRGLRLAFFSQRNFVIEVFISCAVIISAILLKFSITDTSILVLVCLIVLVAELLNTVIEFTLDAVYKNNYSKLVEMAKDISAAMVFLTCTISSIIGIIMFGKYLIF